VQWGSGGGGVEEWEVSDAYTASDHNVILFTFNPLYSVPETKFRNIRKTNWEMFEQYVYANIRSFNSEIDIESKVEQLTKVLTVAFGYSTRESTKGGRGRKRGGNFWNESLQKAR